MAHWYVTGLLLFPHFLNLQQSLSSPVLLHTTPPPFPYKRGLREIPNPTNTLSLRAILLLIVNEFPTLALLEVTLAIILYIHPFLYNILDCVLMLMEWRFSLSLSLSLSFIHALLTHVIAFKRKLYPVLSHSFLSLLFLSISLSHTTRLFLFLFLSLSECISRTHSQSFSVFSSHHLCFSH